MTAPVEMSQENTPEELAKRFKTRFIGRKPHKQAAFDYKGRVIVVRRLKVGSMRRPA